MSTTIVLLALISCARSQSVQQSPAGWTLENDRLLVTVDAKTASISAFDKVARYSWKQLSSLTGKHGRSIAKGEVDSKSVRLTLNPWKDEPPLSLALSLPAKGGDLHLAIDTLDPAAKLERNLLLCDAFVLDTPDAAFITPDYSNGHAYPLSLRPFPRTWFGGDRLDLPFIGIADMKTGLGYMILLETPEDMHGNVEIQKVGGRELAAPRLFASPSLRTFAYPRKLIYHFTDSGGYVALAKRYRSYAKELGILVTLEEKAKKNPNVRKLYGAPDFWGGAGLKFAEEARKLGIDKMLFHGEPKGPDMAKINDLGYLTSRYDNYTDIFKIEEGKGVDAQHGRIPDDVVLKVDGSRMTAWLTWDKKQYMKRCPGKWVETASIVMPKDLKDRPYTGRFIDVTTAEGLYECYDDSHKLSHVDKRRCGEELLRYTASLNLVVGGEHGIWWAVPHLSYIEGMQSGGYASWPAGHLKRPKSKDEVFTHPNGSKLPPWENYEKLGIGHQYRIPLWELVFHDCVVSTWYWGDSTDFLLQAAPDVTAKKDAFNVLYGTIPMYWANKEGGWTTHRELMLRSYRKTCKLHEVIAGTEMLSHEFVTPDRHVQRTRFGDGTEVIVNFGPKPHEANLTGRKFTLPTNGVVAIGPKIEVSDSLVDGKRVLSVRSGEYRYNGVIE